MTIEQEQLKTKEYRERIAEGLRKGTPEGYQELCALCEEGVCLFLSSRSRELTLFRRIMRIWDVERGRTAAETIIGRTAAFREESQTEVTLQQLIDVYTILKFSVFRLESELPEELQIEGILRVLALGLSPGAILLAAEFEAENKRKVLERYAALLEAAELAGTYPRARQIATVLRGAIGRVQRDVFGEAT